jgi:dTDP-4-dehydrorhamnose reductase
MKFVIPGGSGQVGTVLARAFHGDVSLCAWSSAA